MLLGARGNSGVILSQFFAGVAAGFENAKEADVNALGAALKLGVKRAYSTVVTPTEGTILTVAREAVDFAVSRITPKTTIKSFFGDLVSEMYASLERTPNILPNLKEAGVVDSGGAGYLCIASGMYAALTGESVSEMYTFSSEGEDSTPVNISAFTRDSVLKFGYCTELLIRLQSSKVDPDTFDVQTVISYLESIGGESIVAYKTDDVIKLHVHTFDPGLVLCEMRKYGEFLTTKIENMSLQHNETENKKRIPIAVLAVASGEGLAALFKSMGANGIISGGQTNNPSAEEFIRAFDDAAADNIIVLPNNKNILLTAKQAADMYDKAKVYIVPTASLMQGYSALSVMAPDPNNIDSVIKSATSAANGIIDAEITYAVRDACINGREVKKGQFMALSDHEIKATADCAEDALLDLLSAIDDLDDYEIINVFVGAAVSDDARASITELIEERYPDHELIVYEGGQDVYNYLVAIE
jgi:DAK2 domain fusion protein YloV